jgi:hypothetical protein
MFDIRERALTLDEIAAEDFAEMESRPCPGGGAIVWSMFAVLIVLLLVLKRLIGA